MKVLDPRQRDRLVLYPVTIDSGCPGVSEIRQLLVEIGMIDGDMPGKEFMRLLTFMGCSPSISNVDDAAGYNQYSVDIQRAGENVLLAAARLRSPVCPECGERDEQSYAVNQVRETGSGLAWVCPRCDSQISLADIKWRHRLAVAKTFVVVHGVFDGEVIPSDHLLDCLARASHCEWSYCYC